MMQKMLDWRKKRNNKGFSLVELIIVIAIMAILVGILAPQFIKYVNKSRVSTDIKNGQELATAYQADIADGVITTSLWPTTTDATAIAQQTDHKPGSLPSSISTLPKSSTKSDNKFYAKINAETGEVIIYCGASASDDTEVYPTVGKNFS